MKKLFLLLPLLLGILACNVNIVALTPTAPAPLSTSTLPYDPNATPLPTLTAMPPNNWGIITGKLSYPSEFIPPMRVAFFSLTDGKAYFIDTARNQNTYLIYVPVGTYYVIAYPYDGVAGTTGSVTSFTPNAGGFAGGYTQMVPCGLTANCHDHSLIPIVIESNQTVSVDPGDWYAPDGTFPSMPNL